MSSPLVALLLVTSSSRGSHVVFQWPRKPRLVKRYSRMRYYAAEDELDDELLDGAPHAEYLSSSDETSSDASDTDSSEASFEQGAALFGQEEDEERVARALSQSSGTRSAERSRASTRSRSASCAPRGDTYGEEDDARRLRSFTTYLGFDLEMLAAILSPKREQCHHKFELVLDDLAFLGHPVFFERAERQEEDASSLTEFNLVMVIDRPDSLTALPGTDLGVWTHLYYTLLFKITAVLYAEQLRSAYVSQQTATLLALREEVIQQGTYVADAGGWFRDYLDAALAQSSLARALREAQRAIARSRDTVVRVNEAVDLHLQLPPLLLHPTQAPKIGELQRVLDAQDPVVQRGDGPEPRDPLRTLSSLGALPGSAAEQTLQDWTRTTGPFLQPWKTLLLPEDAEDAEESDSIYAFARPLLACFTPSLRGSRTFLQAADALHWDLYKQVYPMVRHLIYYAKARVIDVPRIQGTYALDPTFSLERVPSLEVGWAATFPMMRALPQFLSALSLELKPYVAHFAPRINHTLCLDTLVWLLRHGIVVQMHTHMRLVITAHDQELAYELRQKRLEQRARRPHASDADAEMLIDTLRGQMQRGMHHPERPAHARRRTPRSRSRSDSSDSSGDEWPGMEPISAPHVLRQPSRRRSQPFFSADDEQETDGDDDDDLDELIPHGTPSPVLIPEPSRATRRENEWISAMLHGKHAWYTRWFLRLMPYLNGKHTIEEIVARERLRRRDLKLIMGQFAANLLLFTHP
ncbi:Nitrogen permease regulator 3 [Malassezia obtusa]|uniref:Nitrogen permease regulator 3 n=1 Tax=Malassezia obtusa TaxID=76774 RepID=A0AAF0E5M7_9BASI|nr:Nitrogen permease regulator 3 [Malassezia obtusa]